MKQAIFAMGCFWCGEEAMEAVSGVSKAESGYIGGSTINPTYRQVVNGGTGHIEAVIITYDPTIVTYNTLLYHFWHNIDPLDKYGQFCDKGASYKSGIFCYKTDVDDQCTLARTSKNEMNTRFNNKVTTEIREIVDNKPLFYVAEEYHQDYYIKNPSSYKYYKSRCGRVATLKTVWGNDEYQTSHANSTSFANIQKQDPYLWLKIMLPTFAIVVCLFAFYKRKGNSTTRATSSSSTSNSRPKEIQLDNGDLILNVKKY